MPNQDIRNLHQQLSLQEQFNRIFLETEISPATEYTGEFWLAQPPAQKVVDSTTTWTSNELPSLPHSD